MVIPDERTEFKVRPKATAARAWWQPPDCSTWRGNRNRSRGGECLLKLRKERTEFGEDKVARICSSEYWREKVEQRELQSYLQGSL